MPTVAPSPPGRATSTDEYGLFLATDSPLELDFSNGVFLRSGR